MNRYNFLINYRFDNKDFVDEFSKRFDHITIIEKNVKNNDQILKQLQKSLIANLKRFEKMRINEIKIINTMHVMRRFLNAMHCIKRRLHLNNSKNIE